jgi:hypothetical protein
MFKDKKLRNTFLLSVFAALMPVCIWIYHTLGFGISGVFILLILIVSFLSICFSAYTVLQFLKNWENWQNPILKIVGILLGISGLELNLFWIFIMLLAMHSPSFN